MLIFNKQYRAEEKIISELAKKIKNSETIFQRIEGDSEIYEIHGMWIIFDLVTRKLSVSIGGKNIFELNCKLDAYDKMSEVRYNWFNTLLEKYARKRWSDEFIKQERDSKKSAKMKNARKKIVTKQKNDLNQAILQQALKEIREI